MDSAGPPRRPDEHVTALPGWWTTVQQAEQQALQLTRGTDVLTAATHVVDGIALVTAQVLGPHRWAGAGLRDHDRWAVMARDAVADHEARYGGRLFVFPGQCALAGAMTAREVLDGTVIDELVVPGHPSRIDPQARIEGLDFVRPVYRQGQVVLTLRPIGSGLFTPFERPRTAGALRPST